MGKIRIAAIAKKTFSYYNVNMEMNIEFNLLPFITKPVLWPKKIILIKGGE
jgi:hypothetical protein